MFGSSLRARLAISMSILLALALIMAAVGVTTLARVARTSQETLADLAGIKDLATAMTDGVHTQVREAELQAVTPTAERAARLAALSDSTHGLRRALQRWDGFTPDDHAILAAVERQQSRGEVAWATAHALQSRGRDAEARSAVAAARSTTDSLLSDVQTLIAAQRVRAFARADALQEESDGRRTLLWFLFFLTLVVGASSIAITLRAVTRPLARLVAATQRFGQGDLRAADLSGMPAELAALGGAMNLMSARLRQLTASIRGESREVGMNAADLSAMSQELAASSGEIADAMVRLNEGAGGQLMTLRDAGQQLDELRAAGAETLQAARRVVAVGRTIAAMATDHQQHVRDAATTLLALRETVRRATREVHHTSRLGEGLQVVVDGERQLATKVGVLAVNSAIEAARAGAHGAGITAVTAELRHLEAMCLAAAEQAEAAVLEVQARIRATGHTLEEGSTVVLGVEAVAERAATALEEIGRGIAGMRAEAERVVDTADLTRNAIAAMLERTDTVARSAADLSVTGETVSAATEEQAAATEEMAAAAARLNDAAQRLEELIGEFRA
ncbi:MAG: methyl-accepting chemotaxis protein [Gemmatimonadales bacterium]